MNWKYRNYFVNYNKEFFIIIGVSVSLQFFHQVEKESEAEGQQDIGNFFFDNSVNDSELHTIYGLKITFKLSFLLATTWKLHS